MAVLAVKTIIARITCAACKTDFADTTAELAIVGSDFIAFIGTGKIGTRQVT